jgi:hypothetical protein
MTEQKQPPQASGVTSVTIKILRTIIKGLETLINKLEISADTKLSWGILGAIATIIIVVFISTFNLISPPAKTVAIQPQPTTTNPPQVAINNPPQETAKETGSEEQPEKVIENPTPEVVVNTPEVVIKDEKPPETPKEIIKTEEKPPVILTPEQKLIAGIQDDVVKITGDYGEGLISSIQANFSSSLLVVNVADKWYEFTAEKQDNLALDLLHKARDLDFSRLKMLDSQGKFIARNAVIGENIIILKRTKNAD